MRRLWAGDSNEGRTGTFVFAGLPRLGRGGRSAADFGIEVGCSEDSVGGGKGRVWGSVRDCVQVSGRSMIPAN